MTRSMPIWSHIVVDAPAHFDFTELCTVSHLEAQYYQEMLQWFYPPLVFICFYVFSQRFSFKSFGPKIWSPILADLLLVSKTYWTFGRPKKMVVADMAGLGSLALGHRDRRAPGQHQHLGRGDQLLGGFLENFSACSCLLSEEIWVWKWLNMTLQSFTFFFQDVFKAPSVWDDHHKWIWKSSETLRMIGKGLQIFWCLAVVSGRKNWPLWKCWPSGLKGQTQWEAPATEIAISPRTATAPYTRAILKIGRTLILGCSDGWTVADGCL